MLFQANHCTLVCDQNPSVHERKNALFVTYLVMLIYLQQKWTKSDQIASQSRKRLYISDDNFPNWQGFYKFGKRDILHHLDFMEEKHEDLLPSVLCYAVACPHLERSGMSTACSRSASAHLYHADGRLTSCDGAATDCI